MFPPLRLNSSHLRLFKIFLLADQDVSRQFRQDAPWWTVCVVRADFCYRTIKTEGGGLCHGWMMVWKMTPGPGLQGLWPGLKSWSLRAALRSWTRLFSTSGSVFVLRDETDASHASDPDHGLCVFFPPQLRDRQEVMSLAALVFVGEEEDDDARQEHHHHHHRREEEGLARRTARQSEERRAAATRSAAAAPCRRAGEPHVQSPGPQRCQRPLTVRRPFDLQLPFVPLEADAVDLLHGGRQVGQHVRVRGQSGQTQVGQGRVAAAQRTLDGVGLSRLHVDARQALQAERVLALKHLGTSEDVVELAEADGALQVRTGVIEALRRGRAEVRRGHDDGDLAGGRGGGGGVRIERRQSETGSEAEDLWRD